MNIYQDGTYDEKNPTWGAEDAGFKAKYIQLMLEKNDIAFRSIAEIGCGSGAVLKRLYGLSKATDATWKGYDISPQAIKIANSSPHKKIQFFQKDILDIQEIFDVLLVVDVFEHVPNYLGFVEMCPKIATWKIYHIPLDIHVSSVLRDSLTNPRISVGHLHYFTPKTALATLKDTGHEIVDTIFTPGAFELFRIHPSLKKAIANVPRYIVSRFSPSLSTRLFGGHSLLVLAR